MSHRNHQRRGGRILSVILAVVLASCICWATSVAAGQEPKGVFTTFGHCPVSFSSCAFADGNSGEFTTTQTSTVPLTATDIGIAGLLLLFAAPFQYGRLRRHKQVINRLKRSEINGKQALFEKLENTLLGGKHCERYLIQLHSRVGGQC